MTERTYTYSEMLLNQAAALREAATFVNKWNYMACSDVDGLVEGILALTTDQLALDRHDAELRARVLDPEISKKFTYCAYCGHTESVDVDGEVIAAHIRTCEMHPLNIEIKELRAQTAALLEKAANVRVGTPTHPDGLLAGAAYRNAILALIPTDYATALADRVREAYERGVSDGIESIARDRTNNE